MATCRASFCWTFPRASFGSDERRARDVDVTDHVKGCGIKHKICLLPPGSPQEDWLLPPRELGHRTKVCVGAADLYGRECNNFLNCVEKVLHIDVYLTEK
jgi:hypothetical protein